MKLKCTWARGPSKKVPNTAALVSRGTSYFPPLSMVTVWASRSPAPNNTALEKPLLQMWSEEYLHKGNTAVYCFWGLAEIYSSRPPDVMHLVMMGERCSWRLYQASGPNDLRLCNRVGPIPANATLRPSRKETALHPLAKDPITRWPDPNFVCACATFGTFIWKVNSLSGKMSLTLYITTVTGNLEVICLSAGFIVPTQRLVSKGVYTVTCIGIWPSCVRVTHV